MLRIKIEHKFGKWLDTLLGEIGAVLALLALYSIFIAIAYIIKGVFALFGHHLSF